MSEVHADAGEQVKPAEESPAVAQQHRPVSAEELQLAAQLTQGLAARGLDPVTAATRDQGASPLPLEPAGTASSQQQLAEQLREHLRDEDGHVKSLREAEDVAGSFGNDEDHRRHSEDQSVQLQYYPLPFPAASPAVHTSQAQFAGAELPPRKRSKVSRACDECRRKKIKCDATTESGEDPCSNCRRSNVQCLFSRVPQKRGPSKGYIKELADRIHHIEGKLGTQGMEGLDLGDLIRRESSGNTLESEDPMRKRPFSSISGDAQTTPTSSKHAAWASEARVAQPQPQPHPSTTILYDAGGLAPRALDPPQDDSAALTSHPTTHADDVAAASKAVGLQSATVTEVIYRGYLDAIHPTYPILTPGFADLNSNVRGAPETLRSAFVESLNAAVDSVHQRSPSPDSTAQRANRWLAAWDADENNRSAVTDLMYLQSLLLLVIESDTRGPAPRSTGGGGPPKASLLGRAVGLAYTMGLHRSQLPTTVSLSDTDSLVSAASRCWCALIMLDRWNAISTSVPTMIPNDSVVIQAHFRTVLGDGAFFLLHLSHILGHLAPLALVPADVNDRVSMPILSSWINLAVEGFRLNLPSSITPESHPIVHLAYWHVRLLAYLFSPSSLCQDILWACKESTNLLAAMPKLLSPLSHHFTCLTWLVAAILSNIDQVKNEGLSLVKSILGSPLPPSGWNAAILANVEARQRQPVESAVRKGPDEGIGLQQLADIAATKGGDRLATTNDDFMLRRSPNYEDAGFDPRTLLRSGYLKIIAPLDTTLSPTR